jgi:hypothetical protein
VIFTPEHVQAILEGRKTQTRRICKPGEELYDGCVFGPIPAYRIKWTVGGTYAVQPGRTKPSVARIRILAIRQERLQDISEEDAEAEGCKATHPIISDEFGPQIPDPKPILARMRYAWLWDRINARKGTRWADDPLVWVLTFELVKDGALVERIGA